MRGKIFQIVLLATSLLAMAVGASAQRINKFERRELRADRHEVRADTRDVRSDRRVGVLLRHIAVDRASIHALLFQQSVEQ